jgi:hypothetical protein
MASASISIRCSQCRARIRAPYQLLGKWRNCPGCGHYVVVQLKPPPEAGPALVMDDQSPLERFRRA